MKKAILILALISTLTPAISHTMGYFTIAAVTISLVRAAVPIINDLYLPEELSPDQTDVLLSMCFDAAQEICKHLKSEGPLDQASQYVVVINEASSGLCDINCNSYQEY